MSKKSLPTKVSFIKHSAILSAYLLIVWGFYRVLFKLPDEIEEVFIKPLVWLIPVFYFTNKEKLNLGSLGITFKNFFPSVYLALGLGSIFVIEALISNFVKYNGFNFAANIGSTALLPALGVSLATAISEEISFRGFLFNRLWSALGKESLANFITTIIWTLIHIPVTIFIMKLDLTASIVYLLLVFIFGFGSSYIFAKTKNVSSSILLHLLWEWPIILFR